MVLKSKANRTNEFYTNKNLPNSWFQNKYEKEKKERNKELVFVASNRLFWWILKPIWFGASSWYSLAFVYVTSICVSHGYDYECVSHAPRAHIIDFNLFLNRPISFHHTQAFIANTHTEYYTRHQFIRRFEFFVVVFHFFFGSNSTPLKCVHVNRVIVNRIIILTNDDE